MTIKLNKSVTATIRAEVERRYPNEACGLIIKKGRGFASINCANAAEDPENNFIITSKDFAAAEDMGEVIAVWHSHTDQPSTPSETDRLACDAIGLNWFIFSLCKDDSGWVFGDTYFLEPSGETLDYIGRPYIYGVHDCFTIAQDYYRNEFNIRFVFKAEGYPEVSDWHLKGYAMLSESFSKNGFVQLTNNEEPEIGDLFLIQMGSPTPNHIAIYIGDDRILHHCLDRLSTTDVYGGYYQKHTSHHLRFKDGLKTC